MYDMEANAKQAISSNQFDRMVANWICAFVGYPRLTIRLWNGTEYYFGEGPSVGTMEFHNRRALVDLIISCASDLVRDTAKVISISTGICSKFSTKFPGHSPGAAIAATTWAKLHSLLGSIRGHSLMRSKGQRSSSLRSGQ